MLSSSWANGQHTSLLGRFSIPFEKGCTSVTIQVTVSPGFSGFTNSYYYEEGLLDEIDTFHTYTEPGVYQIVQLTQNDIVPKTDTLIFEVLPDTPPDFEIYECGAQTVAVEITDSNYDFYRVFFTPDDSIDFIQGDPIPTHTYPANNASILLEGHYYNSYPGCGDQFKSINMTNNLQAPTINNTSFSPLCGNLFNLSVDVESDSTLKYQVELSLGNGPYINIYEGPIRNDLLSVNDVVNNGDTDYCIRINVIDPCSGAIIQGTPYCSSIPSDVFTYLSDAYASYSGNNIEIQFNAQPFQEAILKKQSPEGFILVDTLSGPGTISAAGSNHFRLILIDTCQTVLDSADISPPYLTITENNFDTNEIGVELTPGMNRLTESSTELLIYDEDSSIVEVIDFEDFFNLSLNVGSIQRIRARSWFNELSSPIYSNEVVARYIYRIYVPNAFTPNNDGLNDRLQFFGIVSDGAEITIYNRWGQRIHYTDNLSTGWNGYVGDELAPEGTYSYEIKFVSPDGEEIVQVGTFALIKK